MKTLATLLIVLYFPTPLLGRSDQEMPLQTRTSQEDATLTGPGFPDSYRQTLKWYENFIATARAAGKDCPEPPPIPIFMPSPNDPIEENIEQWAEAWQSDIAAARKKKGCPPKPKPTPPIPTFQKKPETLREYWENFRTDLEKFRQDLTATEHNPQDRADIREFYVDGLKLYKEGISDYRLLIQNRRLPTNESQ